MAKLRWLCISLMVVVLFWSSQVVLAAVEQPIPPGFRLVRQEGGVSFFRKDYANGSPDYVQVADLGRGAQVFVLHGKIVEAGKTNGAYGGANPLFARKSIEQFWKELNEISDDAFCVTNGQFFRLADSPTPLPFPLKKDGQVLTDGYGIKEFPGQKLILEVWPDRVDIRELSQENLYGSTAPHVIAGLREDAEKASKKVVGRTFVGVRDQDSDRVYETLLIFNTRSARPSGAADVLRGFGAQKLMMLDGGGSTQLACDDQVYIDTDRLIPQAIGIAAGKLPPFAALVSSTEAYPVLLASQESVLSLQLHNNGSEPWNPDEVKIKLVDKQARIEDELSLATQVPPGESTTFEWQAPKMTYTGLLTLQVNLEHNRQAFASSPAEIEVVVIPTELQDQIPELQANLVTWSSQEGDLQSQVQSWLAEKQSRQAVLARSTSSQAGQNDPADLSINLGYVAVIPLIMLPIFALIVVAIRKLQQMDEDDPIITQY